MMRPTPKTLLLLAVFLGFVGLNLLDKGTGQRISEQLPTVSAVDRKAIRRIELSNAMEKVVLEAIAEESSEGETEKVWHLRAPIEGDADQIAVRTLVSQFRKEIPLDARVDAGNPEDYGLDAGKGLVVEIFEDGTEPVVSFTMGNEGPGGSSFVRLSGDDAIYRARLGGRHRYERPAVEWRNKVLMGFLETDAERVSVLPGESTEPSLVFVRAPGGVGEESKLGPWELSPDAGFGVDQELVTSIVKGLGTLRAGELMGKDFDGGFSPPAFSLVVRLVDGTERAIEVGRRGAERAAFVRRAGEADVFRIASIPVQRFLGRPDDYRDRSMLRFDRADVDILSWESGGERVLLQQDLATSLWNVLEPQNIDIDVKFVFFAVNTLGGLRGDGIADISVADAGLVNPRFRVTARLLSGEERTLVIGGNFRREGEGAGLMHYAMVAGRSEVFILSDDTVTKILRGFGRA